MNPVSSSSKVVCFDLGGVLVRICRSWDEACRHAQLPCREPAHLASPEVRARRMQVVDRYQRGDLDAEVFYAELARAIDHVYSSSEIERIHHAWTREEYPGVLELIRELNRAPRVATACLSNTNAVHWTRLAGEDGSATYPCILELRHRLASHLLRCAKPDAEIYERARATFFGPLAGRPEDIIFFDDLEENVQAAHSVGWTAFRVDPDGDTAAQMRGHLSSVRLLP